ncbi:MULTISPECIES: DNA-3-methyladenine glycosylase [unclassified Nocardioides]|uniref:DNA-3-methyladenine glycosylase n=1 Tax=unclassified Nocardioides TaxID=2615069 RepID=UPI0006F851DA|nr:MULTISPECIES: DNA-3-methyladenine glycosylase [unclassified Nocardioides]KRA31234.1 3-methyladenine DNA glycosylase [Nocardioides sp. Root614]KRA87856.1 3-methyladenine DNA glycosylase [Nocardioides sp. Root682]
MSASNTADVVRRARSLLGRTFSAHGVTIRITEVEAYGGSEDPASHAFTRTPRSEVMYGPPWRLYVYRSYGIHHCANVVTGPTEIGAAVLLRAGEVVDGIDLARIRRNNAPDHQLARGPGNLAQALAITLTDLGTDLLDRESPTEQPALGPEVRHRQRVEAGPRVGVSKAADVPWRFWLAGEASVSSYRRSPRAPAPTATTNRVRPRDL